MITNLNNFVNESLGSSLALPANGLGGSRATSLSVAHFALQNTKFGSEKGKVQNPPPTPPQPPPAGGTEAEAGQFHSPRKIVCPAESQLVFRIFVKKSSNINQKTPPIFTFCEIVRNSLSAQGGSVVFFRYFEGIFVMPEADPPLAENPKPKCGRQCGSSPCKARAKWNFANQSFFFRFWRKVERIFLWLPKN